MDNKIKDEFRSIISYALLGSDTSGIDKETWELFFSECTKYAKELLEKEKQQMDEKDKEIEALKQTLIDRKDIEGWLSETDNQDEKNWEEVRDILYNAKWWEFEKTILQLKQKYHLTKKKQP